jgi:FPC/CPF motif-containing protein YcgG
MHSVDPDQLSNIRLLANALRAYYPLSHSLGPNTSLLIVHPPPSVDSSSVEDYRQKFWAILRGLRLCDLEPWPEDIPTETDAAEWTFCFDGVPWFLAALTPAHEQRQSRRADNFTIAVQPKWVFNNLFKTPETRERAVQAVRKLMPAYDNIEISPDLAAYGSKGSTEAHQYYLLDENETSHCPFKDLDAK